MKNRFDFENYDFRLSPDARRYEPGSMNTVGMVAFNASMELLLSIGMDRIWERVRRLTERILEKAREEGFEMLSPDHPEERSGIVTFRVPGVDNAALWKAMLNRKAMCSPRAGGIRLSPHFYNTPEEVDRMFTSEDEPHDRIKKEDDHGHAAQGPFMSGGNIRGAELPSPSGIPARRGPRSSRCRRSTAFTATVRQGKALRFDEYTIGCDGGKRSSVLRTLALLQLSSPAASRARSRANATRNRGG